MCLIKEDGLIVPDANTYINEAEAEALLNSIGETFGDITETEIRDALLKATRYLESYRLKYKGERVIVPQSLSFPRQNVIIEGYLYPYDEIPKEIKLAQAVAAMLYSQDTDVQPDNDGKTILSESIAGAISVTYADNGATGNTNYFPKIDTYLKLFLKGSSNSLYRA